MTGHDAATQYIEKLAFWNLLKPIGSTILKNIKSTPKIFSNALGGAMESMRYGTGMKDALKGAIDSNFLKGLGPAQLKTLGRAGYGAGVGATGLVGLGVGNSLAGSMKQQQQPDVQVVYANPQMG